VAGLHAAAHSVRLVLAGAAPQIARPLWFFLRRAAFVSLRFLPAGLRSQKPVRARRGPRPQSVLDDLRRRVQALSNLRNYCVRDAASAGVDLDQLGRTKN